MIRFQNRLHHFCVFICFLAFTFVAISSAQQMTPATATSKTPTAVDPAVELWKKGDYASAIAEFQKIIKQDSNNLTLHTTFVTSAVAARTKLRVLKMERQRAQAAKDAGIAKAEEAEKPTATSAKPAVTAEKHPAEPPSIASARPNARPVLTADELAKMEKDTNSAMAALADLGKIYETWAKENPQKGLYPYELGLLAETNDYDTRERCFLKAVELDPKLTDAFSKLADLNSGLDDSAAAMYGLKASETKPDDVRLRLRYASLLWTADPVSGTKLYQDMIQRNAGTKTGLDALRQFANAVEDSKEKVALIEQLKHDYPKDWTPSSGFNFTLFASYVNADSAKGLAFAQDVLKGLESEKPETDSRAAGTAERNKTMWKSNAEYAQSLVDAHHLISEKKGSEALALLEKTKLPRILEDDVQLELLKAEAADASAGPAKAYELLSAKLVKDIDGNLQAAIVKYGARLGKTSQQIDDEIWSRRLQGAETFKDFELAKLGGTEKLKLSDLRGKVVLVDF